MSLLILEYMNLKERKHFSEHSPRHLSTELFEYGCATTVEEEDIARLKKYTIDPDQMARNFFMKVEMRTMK